MGKLFLVGIVFVALLIGIGFLVPLISGSSQSMSFCTLMACMCDGREGEIACNSCGESAMVFQTGILDVVRSCDGQEYQACEAGDEIARASRVEIDRASCRYEVLLFARASGQSADENGGTTSSPEVGAW